MRIKLSVGWLKPFPRWGKKISEMLKNRFTNFKNESKYQDYFSESILA